MEQFQKFDGGLLVAFQQTFVIDWLTPVVTFITHLGDKGFIWILFIIAALMFRNTRKAGIISAEALTISYMINNLFLKNVIARTRPYEVFSEVERLIGRQADFSFPSGHSASSFAVGLVLFLILPKRYGLPCLVLATMIALSRLYVGVHYPSDVICGALSGSLIAYILYRLRKDRLDFADADKEQGIVN